MGEHRQEQNLIEAIPVHTEAREKQVTMMALIKHIAIKWFHYVETLQKKHGMRKNLQKNKIP